MALAASLRRSYERSRLGGSVLPVGVVDHDGATLAQPRSLLALGGRPRSSSGPRPVPCCPSKGGTGGPEAPQHGPLLPEPGPRRDISHRWVQSLLARRGGYAPVAAARRRGGRALPAGPVVGPLTRRPGEMAMG
ncbi:hypothetical protein MTO96_019999 [Rhipicephalus appendiculatus]